MICPNCATENEAGAKFCNECGTPLNAGCPNCGATNKPGARFCNECGTPLTTAAARPATPAPVAASVATQAATVAERRLVTVLFADLVGFTPFAEERDAEDVRETLSRYFDLCSDIVGRYGGTIEKFIGDAVMAVWGAPVAHEDDAERAVRAALDLVGAVKQIAPSVQARAGVLTGEAAVTVGATNQGMVAGDMVNTASRLQSVAPAGTVLVGETTYRAASRAIQFEEAGEHSLKGKDSPVAAWRAVRVVAERGGRNRQSEGLEAPFVGREDELQLLKDLLHATGREGRVRLMSVMGPGGIGKSRLARELSLYVDGLVESIFWHSGRSPAYGEGVTFWALGEMVRGRAGLTETDDEATTREKIAAAVAGHVTDDSQRDWIEKALLALLGVESGVPTDQLFSAWRSFFEHVSAQGTVVMVFEDTHHADTGLIDFIDHMLDFSRGHPIYIVTLARPELLDRRQDWGAGKRNFTSTYLEPLAEPQMRELLSGLVPGLPDSAVQVVIERADGIPLYAVETVRMLVADGRLKEEGGVYVPVGDLTSLAVPESLTALISSRLDSLDAADRSLLHDAAVLGQSFPVEALASVAGRAPADVEQALKGLVRRELIKRELDERSAEVGQYAFIQALIREVAYNTLSKKDRKARHLAAARYFEGIGSDELAGALAGHYLAAHAHATEGVEADALAAQARIALKGAAERAIDLAAYEQAIRFLEQATQITSDPREAAELHERAGDAGIRSARYDQAEPHLREAIRLSLDIEDRRGAARATALLGLAFLEARRNQLAIDVLEPAVAEYGDIGDEPVGVDLKRQFARALIQLERHERALVVIEDVLPVAEHADLVEAICGLLVTKTIALANTGRMREGTALIEGAVKLARDNQLDAMLAAALTVAAGHLSEVDARAALESAREAVELARRLGRRDRLIIAVNNLGYNGFLAGDWDNATAELDAVLAGDMDIGARVWLTSNSLIVHAARGEDVAQGLRDLDALVREANESELLGASLDAHGNAALASGDLESAAKAWRQVAHDFAALGPWGYYQSARCALWAGEVDALRTDLAAFDATGVHGRIVDIRRTTMVAGLAALEGRATEAVRLFNEALVAWRDVGMPWDEALTGVDMVSLLDPGDPGVRAAAASARGILERLGARPFIERLDAAVARDVSAPQSGAGRRVEVEAEAAVSRG